MLRLQDVLVDCVVFQKTKGSESSSFTPLRYKVGRCKEKIRVKITDTTVTIAEGFGNVYCGVLLTEQEQQVVKDIESKIKYDAGGEFFSSIRDNMFLKVKTPFGLDGSCSCEVFLKDDTEATIVSCSEEFIDIVGLNRSVNALVELSGIWKRDGGAFGCFWKVVQIRVKDEEYVPKAKVVPEDVQKLLEKFPDKALVTFRDGFDVSYFIVDNAVSVSRLDELLSKKYGGFGFSIEADGGGGFICERHLKT